MKKEDLAAILLVFMKSLENDLGDSNILDNPVNYVWKWTNSNLEIINKFLRRRDKDNETV